LIRGLAAATALALLAGCTARPTGDFGRAQPGVLHDEILPTLGASRAAAHGEPVSTFNLTDEEREMHDRVWRFLVAPHANDWFYDTAVELQRTRLASNLDTSFVADRYYTYLRGEQFQSSRVRYRKVANDIEIDIATIPSTFAAICRVIEVDRQRAIAVNNVTLAAPDAPAEVALTYRFASYSTALERLLVETPHEEARAVDAQLALMEPYVERARAGDFCLTGGGGMVYKDTGVPSRYQTTPFTPEPIVRK
jgi:hypothetical protein